MLYRLQREISSISQNNMSVAQYYTKLKRFWDELNCLQPIPHCECGATKLVSDITASNRLMQFLMGLNDSFGNAKDHILLMEPLSSVNKAYSMLQKVEKQRAVQMTFTDNNESTTLFAKPQGNLNYKKDAPKPGARRGSYKKSDFSKKEKESQFCDHCNRNGHTRETCFKIHGYPDSYKTLKDQRAAERANAANSTESALDLLTDKKTEKDTEQLSSFIQQEFAKLLKGKMIVNSNHASLAHYEDYAASLL